MEVDRRDTQVGVAELPLDHDERHALASQLYCVGMAELMRREASPHVS
jgi:hypothetical protein